MKNLSFFLLLFSAHIATAQTQFSVVFPISKGTSFDGRLMLFLAKDNKSDPRFQVSDDANSQQIFGQNVDGWQADKPTSLASSASGYPIKSLKDFPAGEYWVQALLHKYETFKLKTGYTVKLPMDRGEGQNFRTAPGNLYSKPFKIKFDPKSKEVVKIVLDQENPTLPEPKDTKYIKHIKIQSKLLTEFWGRPMYLGAHVLLPHGFDEHQEAKFPICINHGHFPADFDGFKETPPPADMDTTDYIARFGIYGYKKFVWQEAYNFYKQWTSKDFPRMLIVEIQHATPYYDDSYAVNSANMGPYGDAITYELIPEIEKQFRGLGKGWARFLYGGSTGGWEALAAQVFYPDEYNGCFAACPDPITFEAYTVVDIYKDENAYYLPGDFKKTPRPGMRNYLGQVKCTIEEINQRELAIGDNSRSGDQWDIWQATYSPAGSDGYPKPIWDKVSGKIDKDVAKYWSDNYDLMHILKRQWATVGKKLQGKIHIYCGDMDNYYLNNAVYLMEDYLKTTKNPHYDGEVKYGDRFEHCWNGDPNVPNYVSRLRYNTMYLPKILKRIEAGAPAGADLKSWRY